MHTEILHTAAAAADLLRAGGRVAVPTETVYGLAARYDQPEAVRGIFAAKSRPTDNPLIVHLADRRQLALLSERVPAVALRLLERFAPGPLTVTVPRRGEVPAVVTAGLPSVAVRIPDSPLLREVIDLVGVPLVAPSANRSGRPSPTTWRAAHAELRGRIEGVLAGPPATVGIESTVVDCCGPLPRLLRPGGISVEQLRQVVPQLSDRLPASDEVAASPGLRHRHYAPRGRVRLFDHPPEVPPSPAAMYLGVQPHPAAAQFAQYHCWPTIEQYAQNLFAAFYQADAAGIETIYCQRVPTRGLGLGLMDRLERAARR
jgi:L-threonylcarbamoyladenylate synthase